MRRVLALAVLFLSCASAPPKVGTLPTPDMDAVVRLIGRFSTAHGCPFSHPRLGSRYALTAGHVVDNRPADPQSPLYGGRWSDGGGHSGLFQAVVAFQSADLAVIEREDKQPFDLAYPLAAFPPTPGERVFILGYDQRAKATAMGPAITEGRVLRIVADNLILDADSRPGSSGSCVLNERSEVVGIVAWGRQYDDGVDVIAPGTWASVAELAKLASLTATE